MTTARIARIGAALVVALVLIFFARGRQGREMPGPSLDRRTAVPLAPGPHEAVLLEMRGMLVSVSRLLDGAARGDTATVLEAARASGMAAAADPELETMLPAGWKEMAEATHGGFDGLAAAVRAARGPAAARDSALAHAARVTASCSGCHETYRLSLAPAAAR